MRVIVICGAGIVSGKEVMSLHLLRELKKRGHECYCITSSWGSNDFKRSLTEAGIPFSNLRIGFISKTLDLSSMRMTMIQAFHMPGLFLRFMKVRRRFQPDIIVHTNFHHEFLLYPVLKKGENIYWSHEIITNSSFYRKLFNLFRKKTDFFVGVSDAVADSLRAILNDVRIEAVKNGILPPKNVVISSRDNRKPFVIAIVGQVGMYKGHGVLFNALKGIEPGSYECRIIGSGSEQSVSELKALSEQLGIADHCKWMGYLKDPAEIYGGVDAVVVPSIVPDSYPTIVMEAGLRGIPVATSSIGGLPEMVVNGVNGFLSVTGDADSLRESITRIISSEDYEALRKSTLEFAQSTFGIELFGQRFEDVLKQAVEQKK